MNQEKSADFRGVGPLTFKGSVFSEGNEKVYFWP